MFKINKKTEYALISLRHIAEKSEDNLSSAKEISEKYQTPFDATSRVLQQLASAGWLQSEQGAYGGYRVAKPLSNLSMKGLCEIIEGPQAIVKCLSQDKSDKICDLISTCNMISPLSNLNSLLIQFLEKVSIAELLEDSGGVFNGSLEFENQYKGDLL